MSKSELNLHCADILSPRAVSSSTPSARSAPTPFAAAAALPEPAPALPEDWEGVCQWVMRGRIALWDEIFEEAFLQVVFLSALCNMIGVVGHIQTLVLRQAYTHIP